MTRYRQTEIINPSRPPKIIELIKISNSSKSFDDKFCNYFVYATIRTKNLFFIFQDQDKTESLFSCRSRAKIKTGQRLVFTQQQQSHRLSSGD